MSVSSSASRLSASTVSLLYICQVMLVLSVIHSLSSFFLQPQLLDEYSDPFDLKKQIADNPELLGACAQNQGVADDDYSVPYEVKKLLIRGKLLLHSLHPLEIQALHLRPFVPPNLFIMCSVIIMSSPPSQNFMCLSLSAFCRSAYFFYSKEVPSLKLSVSSCCGVKTFGTNPNHLEFLDLSRVI